MKYGYIPVNALYTFQKELVKDFMKIVDLFTVKYLKYVILRKAYSISASSSKILDKVCSLKDDIWVSYCKSFPFHFSFYFFRELWRRIFPQLLFVIFGRMFLLLHVWEPASRKEVCGDRVCKTTIKKEKGRGRWEGHAKREEVPFPFYSPPCPRQGRKRKNKEEEANHLMSPTEEEMVEEKKWRKRKLQRRRKEGGT